MVSTCKIKLELIVILQFTHFVTLSRTGVRSITKKLKKSHTAQNKPGRSSKHKISKALERKVVRGVSEYPRTIVKTVKDLAKLGIVKEKQY